MSEQRAWAQWWALPWEASHADWRVLDQKSVDALCRAQHTRISKLLGIEPCLPPPPHTTVLRLALASTEQLNQMLALLGNTCHRPLDGTVSDIHHLWCLRLSKALSPEALLQPDDDPLQLLRAWVPPAIWQRLRLRFSRPRVQQMEATSHSLEDAHSRLDTLWQAIVWRVTTTRDEDFLN
ncbi:type III secretion protein [Pseudomonas sp. O39]|uniref:type III secretion protein n=1 Tax=Pseudomonas sp. O39 TaxID=3379130 RepID=UPI00387B9742